MQLDGRVALVTGSGTGVGRETALSLARRGCSVAVNYSRSKDAAEEVAGLAAKSGVKSVAIRADVAQDAECRGLVERTVSELGRLDVLVNNAGTTRFIAHEQLDEVSDEDWEQILGVNLKGPFQCTRAALPHLKEARGEIVNVASTAGLNGRGSSIPYGASKAGLIAVTYSLARVVGPEVRVNAVAPGFIDGAWLKEGLGAAYEPLKGGYAARSPLGAVTTPEDIAAAILGMIEGPDVVTGQVHVVDAGFGLG